VRSVLAAFACLLISPGAASGAIFLSRPYEGATLPAESAPFQWRFASTYPSDQELGGVSYELNPGHVVVRCLELGTASLYLPEPGQKYTISISDDYSPRWLAERSLPSTGGRCSGDTPGGQNTLVDSLTIAGTEGPPLPANEVNRFEGNWPPGAAEEDALAAREEQSEYEAQQRAREEQAKLAAAAQQPAPSVTPPAPCVVPALAGRSLTAAKRLLIAAHCRLGRVIAPKRRGGKLAIFHQAPSHGMHLAAGASVAVRLAAVKRS